MTANTRVVVIAGSVEGMDALARLINLLPSKFSAPLVTHIHGLRHESIPRFMRNRLDLPSRLKIVSAAEGEEALAGYFYVAPEGKDLVFTASGVLSFVRSEPDSGADRLFESAALFHGRDVIGVVLSGLGKDGTHGLKAITEVGGTRIVQSPSETAFPGMPSSALLGDNVEHSVLLDQMGGLLASLVQNVRPDSVSPPGMYVA